MQFVFLDTLQIYNVKSVQEKWSWDRLSVYWGYIFKTGHNVKIISMYWLQTCCELVFHLMQFFVAGFTGISYAIDNQTGLG